MDDREDCPYIDNAKSSTSMYTIVLICTCFLIIGTMKKALQTQSLKTISALRRFARRAQM